MKLLCIWFNLFFNLQEDLLIHGDSVYDVIDKQDQQAVRSELSRAPTDGEDRVFLCRMNVARNARRQMRFGDQKVGIIKEILFLLRKNYIFFTLR